MSEYKSVARVTALQEAIEAKTGSSYTDLADGVQVLLDGYGQGGDKAPFALEWYSLNPGTGVERPVRIIFRGNVVSADMFSATVFGEASIEFEDINQIERICNRAFKYTKFSDATFPNAVYLGTGAFEAGGADLYQKINTVFLPKITSVPTTAFMYQKQMQTVQIGSIGYGVTDIANSAFSNVTQSTLTITVYCNGVNADTLLTNIRNGATAAIIVMIASEDTSYNGTDYVAGETMITSTVEG